MAVTRVRFILLVCGVMAFQPASLRAEEPSAAQNGVPSASAAPPVNEPPAPLTPEQIEKRKKAFIGMAALAGIVIVGMALGALTILWAGRLRRQLRQPDIRETSTVRSFWFLKPTKPSITKSSLPELNRPLDAPPPQASPPSEPE